MRKKAEADYEDAKEQLEEESKLRAKLEREVKAQVKGGKDMQYESLWFHPQGEWLLAAVGGTQKGAVLTAFDLKQTRLLKEVAAPGPMFGLAVGEKLDVFYTVGRGAALRWDFSA